jgi:two-component system response regulator HydG
MRHEGDGNGGRLRTAHGGERSILIVDDDPDVAQVMSEVLRASGMRCELALSGEAAIAACRQTMFDLVVSDVRLGVVDGIDLMADLRRIQPGLPVILVTAEGSITAAVQAMKRGASQYITKPFTSQELRRTVHEALAPRTEPATDDARRDATHVAIPAGTAELVGSSPAMKKLREKIELIAAAQSPVLIMGETGSGKELVARAIHACSDRRARPFVTVNAAAIPESLLESEMFGHARGAFTGATQVHRGLFAEADGGTLFLDEIGDMPITLQSKLLRALQTGEIRGVGTSRPQHVDVRVVAATHRNLPLLVKEGRFRDDLFYRLDVVHVAVPPLRMRATDIPELIVGFVARARERAPHSPVRTLSAELVEVLGGGTWPGNVRELQSVIERLVVLATVERLEPRHLALIDDEMPGPDSAVWSPSSVDGGAATSGSLEATIRGHVESVLAQNGGHKARAAKALGVDLSTLYRWQQKWKS